LHNELGKGRWRWCVCCCHNTFALRY